MIKSRMRSAAQLADNASEATTREPPEGEANCGEAARCRIEERQFETPDRMLNDLAVDMIVAWRTLFACRLGRSCPDLNCEAVFDASEWQSVWTVTHRGEPLPSTPPKLCEMIRLIAGLGGDVIRTNR